MQRIELCKNCYLEICPDEKICAYCNEFNERDVGGHIGFSKEIGNLEVRIVFFENKYNCINKYCQQNNILYLKQIPSSICKELCKEKGVGKGRTLTVATLLKKLLEGVFDYHCEREMKKSTISEELYGVSLFGQMQTCVNICSYLGTIRVDSLFENKSFLVFRKSLTENKVVNVNDILAFKHENLLLDKVRGLGEVKRQNIIDRFKSITNLFLYLSGVELIECEEIKAIYPFVEIKSECEFMPLSFFNTDLFTTKTINEFNRRKYYRLKDLRFLHIDDIFTLTNADSRYMVSLAANATISLEYLLSRFFDSEKQDRDMQIFLLRAEGETLQAIGTRYGITREGVRQILHRRCCQYLPIFSDLARFYMQRNERKYIAVDEINNFFDDDLLDLIFSFSLKSDDGLDYLECAEIFIDKKAIPNAKNRLLCVAKEFVGEEINLNKDKEEFEDFLGNEGFDFINVEQVIELLEHYGYKKYDNYLYPRAVSYGYLASKIVAEHFPNGIKMTDEESIKELKRLFIEKFASINLPEGTRAFAARVSEFLVLSDRGMAIAEVAINIDISTLERIKEYIDNSQYNRLYYYGIFQAHEGLLAMTSNIDNHHYLHGALKKFFPNDYEYSRDYLQKKSVQTYIKLTEKIENYIKIVNRPIAYKELELNLGCSCTTIYGAVQSDRNLIQWGKDFVNTMSLMDVSQEVIKALRKIIVNSLENNDGYCYTRYIHHKIINEQPVFINGNDITTPDILKGILFVLFRDEFDFNRGHIAKKGTFKNLTSYGVMKQLFGSRNPISYREIVMYFEKLRWSSITISAAFSELEKECIRISDDLYVKTENTLIGQHTSNAIINRILEYFDDKDFYPSCMVYELNDFPDIGYEWNLFLLNSLLEKMDWDYIQIRPIIKDRRYNRVIYVKKDLKIDSYAQLIAYIMKKQNMNYISEREMLSLLIINGLAIKILPHDIYDSKYVKFEKEKFILV